MKKKLYFEPIKETNLNEFVIFEYGKIREVRILQLGTTDKRLLDKDLNLSKDAYLPLIGFKYPLNFKRVDRYIAKQQKLKYTHEVLLPENIEFNPLKLSDEFILKGILKNRKMYIKLSVIDLLLIDAYSFSWASANMAIKISIIAIFISTIATIISTIAVIIGVLSLY